MSSSATTNIVIPSIDSFETYLWWYNEHNPLQDNQKYHQMEG